jgi:ParB family chromosome partitioning protein
MALRLDHLALDSPAAPTTTGAPMLLAIDTIDEDADQPRREFDPQALKELADTIAERGVRQPISVRPHPEHPGRWLVNFGARRLRASKLAGRQEIPAFVDNTADSYDQVIENEQREGLKPLELALFVQRRLAAGESQADVARRLGKSRTFITMVCAMIDPPAWLVDAYRSGRCRGITELYELRKLHESCPDEVQTLISDGGPLTRQSLLGIKDRASVSLPTSPAVPRTSRIRLADVPSRSIDARTSTTNASSARSLDAMKADADRHCSALESAIDRLKAVGATGDGDPLGDLRIRLAALATR